VKKEEEEVTRIAGISLISALVSKASGARNSIRRQGLHSTQMENASAFLATAQRMRSVRKTNLMANFGIALKEPATTSCQM